MKKRICFLTDSVFSFGGVQRVTSVIAKELAKDNDVTILTLDRPEQKDTSFYDLNEAAISYRFFAYPDTPAWKNFFCKAYSFLYRRVLPQTRMTSAWYSHSSFSSEKRDALAAALLEGEFDVIVGVHAPLAVRLSSCADKLLGVKLIGWIHNSYEALFGAKSLYIGAELRKHYEYQLERLDATVVLCQADAMMYHFPTRVIYNPLTLVPDKRSSGTSRKFLAVGRFSHRHKGFDLLIKAFSIFAKHDKDWTLDIVGEGDEEPLYRSLIHEYQLYDRITIHPFTSRVQEYYHAAQVYVLSSRWEGFGLVLIEAMAHGLPVVSSDLPTSKEIMGDFGLYFSNGDVNGLASQLSAATQLQWAVKSEQALQIAQRFNITTVISQWKKLINEE